MTQNLSPAVMAQRSEPHDSLESQVSVNNESWLGVPGWPGYEISDLGKVRSWKWPGARRQWVEDRHRAPRTLAQEHRNGYLSVRLSDAARGQRHENVHVLVLEAFVGPRPAAMQGAHKDGDGENNRLSNLAWKTAIANNVDKVVHGTLLSGESIASAKLTWDLVKEIRARRSQGEPVAVLARAYGVCRNTVTSITTDRAWRQGARRQRVA